MSDVDIVSLKGDVSKQNELVSIDGMLNFLESMRYIKCSTFEKIKYSIPKHYDTIDLLSINDFCVYVGTELNETERSEVQYWISEAQSLFIQLKEIFLLLVSFEKTILMNEICKTFILQQKLEYIHLIFKNLNDIVCKKRKCMNVKKEKRTRINISGIPPFLLPLIELYIEGNHLSCLTIAEFAIFLADTIQSNLPLIAKEKTSLKIVLEASLNKKYPLMTRKHLSFRLFHFLSSISALKIYAHREDILEKTFLRKK